MGQADDAGTPDPLDFRRHRRVGSVTDGTANSFFEGATFSVAGGAFSKLIPCAGALALSLRGLFTNTGTLSFTYQRPAPASATAYGTGNPANVSVAANTEFLTTINPNGEGWVLVTFTPSATGVVTFFDQMQQ